MHLAHYPDTPRAMRLFPSRALQRLVLRHALACSSLGLDVGAVHGEDDTTVSRWLAERAGVLPTALADDLERIDQLTTDRGASVLIESGARAGVDVCGLGLDPLEVAVHAFLDHGDVFEAAHCRQVVAALKGTTEFSGRSVVAARAPTVAELQQLEAQMGQHFEARARSPHCRVATGRDGERVVFTIARGALVRADEALEGGVMVVRDSAMPVYMTERTLRYRPQRRDVVVYDSASGQLRIRAGDAASVQAYRRAFGNLLHGDAEWFGNDPVVSLEPLVRLGRAIEEPTPGLAEVRVVGLIVRYPHGDRGTVAIDSDDIWPFLENRMRSTIADGELLEASFRIFRPGIAASTLVRARVPNIVKYGKLDDTLFRPYLEARGILAGAASRVDA